MSNPASRRPSNNKHDETAYLLGGSENARQLRESIAEADRGDFVVVEFDEVGIDRPLRVVRRYKNHKPVD